MKPVLILQHTNSDGPAYLQTWLQREGRPFEIFNSEARQAFPSSIGEYSALAVLGGEMSANDPLPSLRDAERLIREAVDVDLPVIGHCLGGQLMARALGAQVHASPQPEVGWHTIHSLANDESVHWLGNASELTVFQWHYDAFELPPGATAIATSPACPHQAFAVGRHLAMQFHVELDAAKLPAWAAAHEGKEESATVHASARMLEDAKTHLTKQKRLADRIYSRWLANF